MPTKRDRTWDKTDKGPNKTGNLCILSASSQSLTGQKFRPFWQGAFGLVKAGVVTGGSNLCV
jgi:hypothetical protein